MRWNPLRRADSPAPQPLPALVRKRIQGAYEQLALETAAGQQVFGFQCDQLADQLREELEASYLNPEGRRVLLLDDGFARVYADELRSIGYRRGELAQIMAEQLGLTREESYSYDEQGLYATEALERKMEERSGQLTWRELLLADPDAFADYVVGLGRPADERTTEHVLDRLVDTLFRRRLSTAFDEAGRLVIEPRNEQARQRQQVAMDAEDAALAAVEAQSARWQRDDAAREFDEYATVPATSRPRLGSLDEAPSTAVRSPGAAPALEI